MTPTPGTIALAMYTARLCLSHNKHTPISFAEECVSLSIVFVFSLAVLSNPLLLLFALYVLRFSFYSVRLMLSIYDSKFAPILWYENTHLSFCFRFSLCSLSLAVLNNRFLWLLSFGILRFSSTEFSRDFRGMITLSKLSALSFN